MKISTLFAGLASLSLLGGCQGTAAPLPTVPHVDLERFMGDWYVIACIPTYIEKGAHNPVESYRLEADGTIATTFTFRAGGFDGKAKRYKPRGFVIDRNSNAIWGMQFMWPIKADYRIIYLDAAYGQTIIGRQQRDYLWIMARTPQISAADYQRMVDYAGQRGYDLSRLQKMPQQWQ
ncbi:MAG: lipocalin family protein [Steroidobacteraceae bacterium]